MCKCISFCSHENGYDFYYMNQHPCKIEYIPPLHKEYMYITYIFSKLFLLLLHKPKEIMTQRLHKFLSIYIQTVLEEKHIKFIHLFIHKTQDTFMKKQYILSYLQSKNIFMHPFSYKIGTIAIACKKQSGKGISEGAFQIISGHNLSYSI